MALDASPLFAPFRLGDLELKNRMVVAPLTRDRATGGDRDILPFDYLALRRAFGGAYVANNGYTREMAGAALREGRADFVAFGKLFLANPDLPEPFRVGAPLDAYDNKTFYGGGAKGYRDYPTMAES